MAGHAVSKGHWSLICVVKSPAWAFTAPTLNERSNAMLIVPQEGALLRHKAVCCRLQVPALLGARLPQVAKNSDLPAGSSAPWGPAKVVRRLPVFLILASLRRTFVHRIARSKTVTIN